VLGTAALCDALVRSSVYKSCYIITYLLTHNNLCNISFRALSVGAEVALKTSCIGGGLAQLVATLVRSMKLLYAGPGWYWDGWPYRGSIPGAGNLSQSNQPPRSTQPDHPFVDKRNRVPVKRAVMLCDWGVKADLVLFAGNTVWSVSERVRSVCVDALYKSTFTLLYFIENFLRTVYKDIDLLAVFIKIENAVYSRRINVYALSRQDQVLIPMIGLSIFVRTAWRHVL